MLHNSANNPARQYYYYHNRYYYYYYYCYLVTLCSFAAPSCSAGLDIGILLDKTKSVSTKDLEKVITFLKDLVNKFNPAPDEDHFGLITFQGNTATLKFDFAASEFYSKNRLLDRIDKEPTKKARNWGTRTDLALIEARDKLFTQAGGDRPHRPNVMLVLTDGKPFGLPAGLNFAEFCKNILIDFQVSTHALLFNRNPVNAYWPNIEVTLRFYRKD